MTTITIAVLHRIDSDFWSKPHHEGDLRKVATLTQTKSAIEDDNDVENMMGYAFHLTNSIDKPWAEANSDRLAIEDLPDELSGWRSTSVGDVMRVTDGDVVQDWFVAPMGFEKIELKPGLRAYLIDAAAQAVTEIEYLESETSLEQMYKLIGCELVDTVHLDRRGTVAFVDDEGLLNEDQQNFWLFDAFEGGQAFAGNAVVLGTGPEGQSVSPRMPLEVLQKHVTFKRRDELQPHQYTPEMHFQILN